MICCMGDIINSTTYEEATSGCECREQKKRGDKEAHKKIYESPAIAHEFQENVYISRWWLIAQNTALHYDRMSASNAAERCANTFTYLHFLSLFSRLFCAGRIGVMGYGWTGGLRQIASLELSRHRCHPHVLLRRLAWLLGKYSGKVDARGLFWLTFALTLAFTNIPNRFFRWNISAPMYQSS